MWSLSKRLIGSWAKNNPQSIKVMIAIGIAALFILILVPIILLLTIVGGFLSMFEGQGVEIPVPQNMYQEVFYDRQAPCIMDAMGINKVVMLETTLFPVEDTLSNVTQDENGNNVTRELNQQQIQDRTAYQERLKTYYIDIYVKDEGYSASVQPVRFCMLRPLNTIYSELKADGLVTDEKILESKEVIALQEQTLFSYPILDNFAITTYAPSYTYKPYNQPTVDFENNYRFYNESMLSGNSVSNSIGAFHMATDLAPVGANKNVDVYAMIEGTIKEVINNREDNLIGTLPDGSLPYCGNKVRIEGVYPMSETKMTVTYCHFKKNSVIVKEGDKVSKGDKIAQVGNSGYSTGPHLHFEISGDLQGYWRTLSRQENVNPNHFLEFGSMKEFLQLVENQNANQDPQ